MATSSWLPSIPYPEPGQPGYWEPITSTLNWCEEVRLNTLDVDLADSVPLGLLRYSVRGGNHQRHHQHHLHVPGGSGDQQLPPE